MPAGVAIVHRYDGDPADAAAWLADVLAGMPAGTHVLVRPPRVAVLTPWSEARWQQEQAAARKPGAGSDLPPVSVLPLRERLRIKRQHERTS